jgi:hypothetical protein
MRPANAAGTSISSSPVPIAMNAVSFKNPTSSMNPENVPDAASPQPSMWADFFSPEKRNEYPDD